MGIVSTSLELAEAFGVLLQRLVLDDTEHVEADSLGQRPALTNSDLVSDIDTERWAGVRCQVLVPLLVPVVLGYVVEVLPSDDDCAGHLCGDDLAAQDAAPDGDQTGPGALLVDVGAVDGLTGCLEPEADVLVPSLGAGGLAGRLGVQEDGLPLEGLLALYNELAGHGAWLCMGRLEEQR